MPKTSDIQTAPNSMRMAEYIESAGQRCPYCRSFDVHQNPRITEGEDGFLRRAVRCYECGRSWNEVYQLKRWEGR